MTMTDGSTADDVLRDDDDALADVFGSEREDRGGKEPAPAEPPVDDQGQPRDEHGRFAAKSKDEQQPPADQQQQAAQPDQEHQPDPNANRQVPLSELLSERKKFKAREEELTRLHLEAEARAKAYEQFQTQQRQVQPPQQQQPVQPPDPLTDPEGYREHVNQVFEQRLLNERCNISEVLARRHYGSQVVDEAVQAATQAGISGQSFALQPDPYGALVEWHRREKALAKFGSDPDAYEKQLEQQIREKVLAELKAGGVQGQQPQRFPGTLASATATGPQGAVLTEEAMMQDVFGSERRNRRK